MNPYPFLAGVALAAGVVVHSLVDRYRNIEPKFDDTRLDHARYVVSKINWAGVTLWLLLGGIAAHVLWFGLNEVVPI